MLATCGVDWIGGGWMASEAMPVKIDPISPDEDERKRRLSLALNNRSFVCICGLALEFHVGAAEVEATVKAHPRFTRSPLEHPEPVFVARDVDWEETEAQTEFNVVVEEIEFAIGLTEDCFPGYERGRSLEDQRIGSYIKSVLRSAVTALLSLELVPSYFRPEIILFNHTAIILMLRHIFQGDREAIKVFIRDLKSLDGDVGGTAKRVLESAHEFDSTLSRISTRLDRAHEANQEFFATFQRHHA